MKFIDMFCGIGTIRMGMEQAGHECVYSIEWDKHKRQIYSIIFGGEPEDGDITKISANELPRADCWCFGSPCQDLSIAGKRKGLINGERSSMFFEVMRLLQETKEEDKPSYLLFENVKGLFSSNGGKDFLEVLYQMDLGGYDTEWQLVNSKWYVPQNRERIFVIGHLRGRSTGKVFPIGESSTVYNKAGENQEGIYEDTRDIALTLTAKGQSNWTGSFVKQAGNCMPTKTRENPNQGRIYDTSGISPTLSKCEGDGRQPFVQVRACLTPDRLNKRQNGRRFKEPGEPMLTLTKQDMHGVAISYNRSEGAQEEIKTAYTLNSSDWRGLNRNQNQTAVLNGSRIRRLTPKECWRLQGIPDEITDKVMATGISDTQMYRGAGDATTVNVIYEIAKRMG